MSPERKNTTSALPRRVLLRKGPLSLALALVLLTLTSSEPTAAEPVTTTVVVVTVAKAFGKAKAAYDAYKFFGNLINPEPTTAELIDRAVETLRHLTIGTAAAALFADGQKDTTTARLSCRCRHR